MNEQHDYHVLSWIAFQASVKYWMKHPGLMNVLAGEPREVTDEIIRRLLLLEDEDE